MFNILVMLLAHTKMMSSYSRCCRSKCQLRNV